MSDAKIRTVVVLGTHRSGTSVVAGMLHQLGVRMGPPGDRSGKWIYPNWANPLGQYENPEFSDLLHRLMDFDGGEPRWDPRWNDMGERWRLFEDEFVRLLRYSEFGLWGWKQAWTMLVIDRLMPHLRGPVFVDVRRPIEDVVVSLHRRDGLDVEEAETVTREIWNRMDSVEDKYPDVPVFRVTMADLQREPILTAMEMADFLGVRGQPEKVLRAAEMFLEGDDMKGAVRRLAARDLTTIPSRYGWLLKDDLTRGSRFAARHLAKTAPRELYRTLRASVA